MSCRIKHIDDIFFITQEEKDRLTDVFIWSHQKAKESGLFEDEDGIYVTKDFAKAYDFAENQINNLFEYPIAKIIPYSGGRYRLYVDVLPIANNRENIDKTIEQETEDIKNKINALEQIKERDTADYSIVSFNVENVDSIHPIKKGIIIDSPIVTTLSNAGKETTVYATSRVTTESIDAFLVQGPNLEGTKPLIISVARDMTIPEMLEEVQKGIGSSMKPISTTEMSGKYGYVVGNQVFTEPIENVIKTEKKKITLLEKQKKVEDRLIARESKKQKEPEVTKEMIDFSVGLLEKMGVKIEKTNDQLFVEGKNIPVNEIADITEGIVRIVTGKGEEFIPEAAMHFFVEHVERTDNKLFRKLLSEVNQYEDALRETFDIYKDIYTTEDGKPDVLKIKKEAIARVLMDHVSRRVNEDYGKSLWQKIVDFIKSLFAKSGFDIAALRALYQERINFKDSVQGGKATVYYNVSPGDKFLSLIKDKAARLIEKQGKYYLGNALSPLKDVIELVNEYSKKTLGREYQDANEDSTVSKFKTGLLKDVNHILDLYIDENGNIRKTPLSDENYSPVATGFEFVYDDLKEAIVNLLASFPAGTKFIYNTPLYNQDVRVVSDVGLIAIEPSGKTNIVDWGVVITTKEKGVPYYRSLQWKKKIDLITELLTRSYGIKEIGVSRTLPIQLTLVRENRQTFIRDIYIPGLTKPLVSEQPEKILPVVSSFEPRKEKELKELINKLNKIYEETLEKKAQDRSEKEEKIKELNSLLTSIMQIEAYSDFSELSGAIENFLESAKFLDQAYKLKFRGEELDRMSPKELEEVTPGRTEENEVEEFLVKLNGAIRAANAYSKFYPVISQLQNIPDEVKKNLSVASSNAASIEQRLRKIHDNIVQVYVANANNISGLLRPEAPIDILARNINDTSLLQSSAIQLFTTLVNRQNYAYQTKLNEKMNRLMEIKSRYDEWAKKKGLNKKNYFSFLVKPNKNELISRYKSEFYSELKKAIKENRVSWIKANVDIKEVERIAQAEKEREIKRAKEKVRFGTPDEIEKRIEEDIKKIERKYKLEVAIKNYEIASRAPLSKWYTKEYALLQLPENAPAKELYDFIIEGNRERAKAGYIPYSKIYSFLPFVHKSIEEDFQEGNFSLKKHLKRAIYKYDTEVGYGEIDPITKQPVNELPKYFTREVEDYSTDLFKNLYLLEDTSLQYQYYSEIEQRIKSILEIERNKPGLLTTPLGEVVGETAANITNARLLENIIKTVFYGHRYADETGDISFAVKTFQNRAGQAMKNMNSFLGQKVFPEESYSRSFSLTKYLETQNYWFTLTRLGFNPLSALSTIVGGSLNAMANAGKYFTTKDVLRSEVEVLMGRLANTDAALRLALFDKFLPFEGDQGRKIKNKLSNLTLKESAISEFLMALLRNADMAVKYTVTDAFLKNTIVIDGGVYNAREYARKKIGNIYTGSTAQMRLNEQRYEEMVKDLIEKHGIMKKAKLVNNKLVIEGLDENSPTINSINQRLQSIINTAIGTMSKDSTRMINTSIWGKSFMIFKNWIPTLMDVRFGELKYKVKEDAYSWGRLRMIFRVMLQEKLRALDTLQGVITLKGDAINRIRELYEAKKEEMAAKGVELKMTEEEFIDLVRQNTRNALKDAIFMATLFSLYLAAKAYSDDDEEEKMEPEAKNALKYTIRALDKLKDELFFFYDPSSTLNLFTGGLIPSLSVITDARKAVTNFAKEFYGIVVDDQKIRDDAKVIKYVLKEIPLSAVVLSILPIFAPELAKELGVQVSEQGRINQ